MTGIGTGVSAMGQYEAGKTNKKIAYQNADSIEKTSAINVRLIEEGTAANAAILDFNAQAADAQAKDAVTRGLETEGQFRKQLRGYIGTQRAGYAGQGVDVSMGSPLDVQMDTARQGELDALKIEVNAWRESWGYKMEAENTRMQAGALRKTGKLQAEFERAQSRAAAQSARMGGNFASAQGKYGAFSTIIGGAGNVAMQKYGYQKRTT